MSVIYHVTSVEGWAGAQAAGHYAAASLTREGFIHCSTPAQVVATSNRFFHGQRGLLLLAIDPAQVEAEIRMENTSGGSELFPHIYGVLNLSAVTARLPFEPDADGTFRSLPAGG